MAVMHPRRPHTRTLSESVREYGRGIAGGLLFSLPLLYTEEVWRAGLLLSPLRQLAALALTFGVLLGYNRYAGLRPERSWTEIVLEAVEELGLGLLLAALVLVLLSRITPDQHPNQIVGLAVMEGICVAIGVSVGTAQLGARTEEHAEAGSKRAIGFGGQLVIAFCGAILLAANIAPTDEMLELAAEASAIKLIAIGALSLALGGFVLFFGDFRGSRRWSRADSPGAIARGTVITYATALVASAVLLWLFGRFDGAPPTAIVGQTVVLGAAATIGAIRGNRRRTARTRPARARAHRWRSA
jgi:putative integral membrane protein (TIGR02587 family)